MRSFLVISQLVFCNKTETTTEVFASYWCRICTVKAVLMKMINSHTATQKHPLSWAQYITMQSPILHVNKNNQGWQKSWVSKNGQQQKKRFFFFSFLFLKLILKINFYPANFNTFLLFCILKWLFVTRYPSQSNKICGKL